MENPGAGEAPLEKKTLQPAANTVAAMALTHQGAAERLMIF
jgi:hypothetical protein